MTEKNEFKKRKFSNKENTQRNQEKGMDEIKVYLSSITEELATVRSENKSLKDEVYQLKNTFDKKMEAVLEILGAQNVTLDTLSKNLFTKPAFTSSFPIKTVEELESLEESITDENKNEMIATIQTLITRGGFEKNADCIFAKELILEFNLDGKQNKKRLQSYKRLMKVLYGAVEMNGVNEKTFLNALRTGLKRVKNRHFKNISINKSKVLNEKNQNKLTQ